MEVVQSRKLNTSTVLNLKPKEPSLGDHKTVTLAVILSLTGTDGDLSNPNDRVSRTNSYSPQHLSRQEGKTSKELMLMLHSIQHMGWTSESDRRKLYFLAKALAAELKKKLHKAKSVVTVKNTVSPLPAPATQKHEVHEIPAVEGETTMRWVQKQRELGLNQAVLNLWEAAGRLNPTDNIPNFRHHKISTPPSKHPLSHFPAEAPHLSGSFKIQNYYDAVEQTKKPHRIEDVEDAEDGAGAPSPRQAYVWTYRKDKQGDSPYLNKSNQLFYKMFGNVNPEEEPTPTESKAEQRLNTKQQVFYNLLVNDSPPAASGVLEDVAEEEGSFPGGYLPAVPRTAETQWKPQKEESSFLNKPDNPDSPDDASVQGDLFETNLHRHLRLLVPDEALRTFIAHVAQALRKDCGLPELQLACAKMVSNTGLLIKLLGEKQDERGDSALVGRCLLEGNVSDGMVAGRKPAGKKPEYTSSDRLLLAISVSVIIMINVTVICLVEVCSQKPAAASQPQSTSKSRPRRQHNRHLIPQFRSHAGTGDPEKGPLIPSRVGQHRPFLLGLLIFLGGSHGRDLSKPGPQWLRDLYQPLDARQKKSLAELYNEESSAEEEIFNESELKWDGHDARGYLSALVLM
ncbi:uncharacterized protein LOC142604961 [Balearica regulorum gibbericeps]|uniref:uncharacterized protein LOC142604961 n=1 Tax=Balearica regulorum gibbericeps TaxID=100784 RepID=UPI003F62C568